jgi:hypothetical protein
MRDRLLWSLTMTNRRSCEIRNLAVHRALRNCNRRAGLRPIGLAIAVLLRRARAAPAVFEPLALTALDDAPPTYAGRG